MSSVSWNSTSDCKAFTNFYNPIIDDRDVVKLKHAVNYLKNYPKSNTKNTSKECLQLSNCCHGDSPYTVSTQCLHGVYNFRYESLATVRNIAKDTSVWINQKNGWRYSIVDCPSFVLLGYLHQDKNGQIYLLENKDSIACVFLGENQNSPLCSSSFKEHSNLVILTNVSFVFEYFTISNTYSVFKEYLLVPLSDVVPFEIMPCSLYVKENLETSLNSTKLDADILEITSILQNGLSFNLEKSLFVCQEIKVIMKTWSVTETDHEYMSVLALISKKKVIDMNSRKNLSCVGLTVNDEADDSLLNTMSSLSIDSNWELCILVFRPSLQKVFGLLISGHSYHMISPFANENKFHNVWSKPKNVSIKNGLTYINISRSTQFLHCSECSSENCFSSWSELLSSKSSSIKDVLSFKTPKNNFIQALLVDKFFIADKLPNEVQPTSEKDLTLCLLLKDAAFPDIVRLYIPCCRIDVLSLLPSSLLLLFGCICMKSQNGHSYLKASSLFGIHVLEHGYSSFCTRRIFNPKSVLLNSIVNDNSPSAFVCHGFLLKILSARMFPTCSTCMQDTRSCISGCDDVVKAEASFQIDDGSNTISLSCASDNVRSLLKLTLLEWSTFMKYVKLKKIALNFNINENISDMKSGVSRIFYSVCSRPSLRRYLRMCCTSNWIAGERNSLKLKYICSSVSELQALDSVA